jgi:thymidine kinase
VDRSHLRQYVQRQKRGTDPKIAPGSDRASAGPDLQAKGRQDSRTQVVGIDEGQFFDSQLVEVCNKLADMGKRVIVAGLDQDYRGRPFDPIPPLLAVAEYITKTLAICMRCGAPANRTQRTIDNSDRVLVGATDSYEARCRLCFEPPTGD